MHYKYRDKIDLINVYFITILSLFYHYFMSILSMTKIRVYCIDNKKEKYRKIKKKIRKEFNEK